LTRKSPGFLCGFLTDLERTHVGGDFQSLISVRYESHSGFHSASDGCFRKAVVIDVREALRCWTASLASCSGSHIVALPLPRRPGRMRALVIHPSPLLRFLFHCSSVHPPIPAKAAAMSGVRRPAGMSPLAALAAGLVNFSSVGDIGVSFDASVAGVLGPALAGNASVSVPALVARISLFKTKHPVRSLGVCDGQKGIAVARLNCTSINRIVEFAIPIGNNFPVVLLRILEIPQRKKNDRQQLYRREDAAFMNPPYPPLWSKRFDLDGPFGPIGTMPCLAGYFFALESVQDLLKQMRRLIEFHAAPLNAALAERAAPSRAREPGFRLRNRGAAIAILSTCAAPLTAPAHHADLFY
jgi:hypothetical protein